MTQTASPNDIAGIYSFDEKEEAPVPVDSHYYATAHQAMLNLNTRILVVAQANDQAFHDACDDFKREYMLPRVTEYEDAHVPIDDFAKQVATGIAAYAGISLLEPFAKSVGKFVAEQISMYLGAEAATAAKTAVQNAGLGKQLEAALGEVVGALAAKMATMHDFLNTNLNAFMQPVTDRLSSGQPLDPGDAAWVQRCYAADAPALDAVIEEYFGIIAPAHLTKMKDAIFARLVEQFNLALIERTEDHTSRLFFDRRTEGERFRDDPQRRSAHEADAALAEHQAQRHTHESELGLPGTHP